MGKSGVQEPLEIFNALLRSCLVGKRLQRANRRYGLLLSVTKWGSKTTVLILLMLSLVYESFQKNDLADEHLVLRIAILDIALMGLFLSSFLLTHIGKRNLQVGKLFFNDGKR